MAAQSLALFDVVYGTQIPVKMSAHNLHCQSRRGSSEQMSQYLALAIGLLPVWGSCVTFAAVDIPFYQTYASYPSYYICLPDWFSIHPNGPC